MYRFNNELSNRCRVVFIQLPANPNDFTKIIANHNLPSNYEIDALVFQGEIFKMELGYKEVRNFIKHAFDEKIARITIFTDLSDTKQVKKYIDLLDCYSIYGYLFLESKDNDLIDITQTMEDKLCLSPK